MKIKYVDHKFLKSTLERIEQANRMIDTHRTAGYDLTLRQLYYRFVATDSKFENSVKSFKNFAAMISKARMAGLISWRALRDGRGSKSGIWAADHQTYLEVWVESNAIPSAITNPCDFRGVPYFSYRGFMSSTHLWDAAQRFIGPAAGGKSCVLLQLGNRDATSAAIVSDISERLRTFGVDVPVRQLALTAGQVSEYSLPPNPAKPSDSWELDALEPNVINALVDNAIGEHINAAVSYTHLTLPTILLV